MPATVKLAARTPERQRLADAIERLQGAEEQHARVNDALGRLDERIFEDLQPELRRAKETLDDALAAAPEQLVAKALGDPADPDVPTVAEAESALKAADQALVDARKARSLLRDEATARQTAVEAARRELDNSVSAVVRTDPTRSALFAAFNRASSTALACARSLRTSGMIVQGFQGSGLMFRITDGPTTTNTLGSAFVPDRDWQAAISLLRSNPDAALPDLLLPEPDIDVGDGAAAEAA